MTYEHGAEQGSGARGGHVGDLREVIHATAYTSGGAGGSAGHGGPAGQPGAGGRGSAGGQPAAGGRGGAGGSGGQGPERRARPAVSVDQFAGTRAREVVLRDLAAEVRRSADALRQEALPHDRGELDRRLEAEAGPARRGVRVRALYPHTLLGEPAHARFLHDLSEAGVIVRVTDHVPHDMLIFDRHTVCLPGQGAADPSHRQPPAMIRIRGSVLVRSLTSIYESYWQRATPLPLARTRLHEQPLDEQERAVIRLMTSGYGDARIARKLGIEQRAVEDVMAALMERLGAGSRFEVGYKLARALGPWDLWPGNG